jgi:hypothetical protein
MRSPQIIVLGLCIVVALLIFSPNLNSYFLSDDFVQIGKVLHGDYSVAWGQEHGGFFRPLFIWSYVFDSHLWGARSIGYHLTNVVVHGLNAFLVFKLATAILQSPNIESRTNRIAAIAAAALFLLHPSHSEAVVWISGRADLLATLFALLCLRAYLAYAESNQTLYLCAALALFAVALLAKESAICTPFLILVIGLFRREQLARLVRSVGWFAFTLLVFLIIRAQFIGSFVGGYGNTQHLNFSPGWLRDRVLEASVRSILPPLPTSWLAVFFKPLQSPVFYLLILLIAAGTATAILIRRRFYQSAERKKHNRLLIMLVALFFMSLLPVINLRLSVYQTLGERFLYLPTVFTCILFAYAASVLIRNPKVVVPFLLLILGVCSISLLRTNARWREAANLSSALAEQLTAAPSSDSVTVVNVPDNLRGVPVFHNGLPEAVRWFPAAQPIAELQILAFQDLQSSSDEVRVNVNDQVTVQAVNSSDKFSRIATTACFEGSSPSSDSLYLQAKPCAPAIDTFFFSGGRIEKLNWRGF